MQSLQEQVAKQALISTTNMQENTEDRNGQRISEERKRRLTAICSTYIEPYH